MTTAPTGGLDVEKTQEERQNGRRKTRTSLTGGAGSGFSSNMWLLSGSVAAFVCFLSPDNRHTHPQMENPRAHTPDAPACVGVAYEAERKDKEGKTDCDLCFIFSCRVHVGR